MVLAAEVFLVLAIAGYTLAQFAGPQGGMAGQGAMGQSGQGVPMGGWMMSMMHGQPLTQEQLDQ